MAVETQMAALLSTGNYSTADEDELDAEFAALGAQEGAQALPAASLPAVPTAAPVVLPSPPQAQEQVQERAPPTPALAA